MAFSLEFVVAVVVFLNLILQHFFIWLEVLFNPLKTSGRLFYLKTQSVPRSKHFSSRL